MEFIDAVHELASNLNLEIPASKPDKHVKTTDKGQYEILQQAASYFRRQLRDHPGRTIAIDYLKGRGLNGEIAANFGIGFAHPDNSIQGCYWPYP